MGPPAMALHTDTEIYRATYSLCQVVTQLVANMPKNYKADFGAELRRRCMGLMRHTDGHHDRAQIANAARKRGHSVDWGATKAYRTSITTRKQT